MHRTRYRTWSSEVGPCHTTHTTVPLPSAHRDCHPCQHRVTAGKPCPSYRRPNSDTTFETHTRVHSETGSNCHRRPEMRRGKSGGCGSAAAVTRCAVVP